MSLAGSTYTLGLRTMELYTFEEVYYERCYERVPGFIALPGWHIVDVGANVGVYTVLQALRGARVLAYEPNPACYARLRSTILANGLLDAVRVRPVALGAADGEASLAIPSGHTTAGAIAMPHDQGGIRVPVCTLDGDLAAEGIATVDLLKVDVEGAEVDVLRGGLAHALPLTARVVLEYHGLDLRDRCAVLLHDAGLTVVHNHPSSINTGMGTLFAHRMRGVEAA